MQLCIMHFQVEGLDKRNNGPFLIVLSNTLPESFWKIADFGKKKKHLFGFFHLVLKFLEINKNKVRAGLGKLVAVFCSVIAMSQGQ